MILCDGPRFEERLVPVPRYLRTAALLTDGDCRPDSAFTGWTKPLVTGFLEQSEIVVSKLTQITKHLDYLGTVQTILS